MSAGRVTRGERQLERLVSTGVLSEDGKRWLTIAIDPFHDREVPCSGFPDMIVAPSCVQLIRQQITIACPPGVTTGTWDANIFNLPYLQQSAMSTYNQYTNCIAVNAGLSLSPMGGVVALTAQTGVSLNVSSVTTSSTGATSAYVAGNCSVPDSYLLGSGRLIAMGFETVNNTAEIYAQGEATVYRVPQPSPTTATYSLISGSGSGSALNGVGTFCKFRDGPQNISTAMLLPGARTWKATEGSYSVVTFSSTNLPPDGDDWVSPLFLNIDEDESNIGNQVTMPSLSTQTIGTVSFLHPTMMAVSPVNTSGVFFTGLSLQTTITVTANFYIERFPGPYESDLIVLATPSPSYNNAALELYSSALSDMPAGVPRRENGMGQWFSDVVSKVSGFLSPALSAIPHPYAKAAGLALGTAGSIAENFGGKSVGAYKGRPLPQLMAPPNARAPLAKAPQRTKNDRDVVQDKRLSDLEKREAQVEKILLQDAKVRKASRVLRRGQP